MTTKKGFLDLRQTHLQEGFGRAVGSNGSKTDQKTKDRPHMNYELIDGKDCFTICARGLNIDNSHLNDCWQWTTGSGSNVSEVAKAVKVKWLGVEGSFDTFNLRHGVQYKVSFLLNMESKGDMKEQTVNLKLTLPNYANQEKPEQLPKTSPNWQALEVGRFKMTEELIGEMKFSMKREFDNWMRGLIINGVQIRALQSKPE